MCRCVWGGGEGSNERDKGCDLVRSELGEEGERGRGAARRGRSISSGRGRIGMAVARPKAGRNREGKGRQNSRNEVGKKGIEKHTFFM